MFNTIFYRWTCYEKWFLPSFSQNCDSCSEDIFVEIVRGVPTWTLFASAEVVFLIPFMYYRNWITEESQDWRGNQITKNGSWSLKETTSNIKRSIIYTIKHSLITIFDFHAFHSASCQCFQVPKVRDLFKDELCPKFIPHHSCTEMKRFVQLYNICERCELWFKLEKLTDRHFNFRIVWILPCGIS